VSFVKLLRNVGFYGYMFMFNFVSGVEKSFDGVDGGSRFETF